MVDGRFKCFGSSQHIKDKFGTGYELEIKIRTLSENDTKEMLSQYGCGGVQNLDRTTAERLLTNSGNGEMIQELVAGGMGDEFNDVWNKNKTVNADEFIRWVFTESKGNKALDFVEAKFKEFQVIEHYGNSWKIKVSRDNYSIGFLFGMMEDIQEEYEISEYSVA